MGETLDLRSEVWQVINDAISDDPSNHEIWQATDAVLAIVVRREEASRRREVEAQKRAADTRAALERAFIENDALAQRLADTTTAGDEKWALLSEVHGRSVAALRMARKELARWGWGDMHYPSRGQEQSVLDALAVIDAALPSDPVSIDVRTPSPVAAAPPDPMAEHTEMWADEFVAPAPPTESTEWYSICSAHREYDPTCKGCNAGRPGAPLPAAGPEETTAEQLRSDVDEEPIPPRSERDW